MAARGLTQRDAAPGVEAHDLRAQAAALPTTPGVYLLKGRGGRVLYVGKAQNLRQRVRSYLEGGDGRPRIPLLVEAATDVEVVLTRNTKEALLLENELIKRHRPRFNVRLRDDKQYLALRLDPAQQWPRLQPVRRFHEDGAHHFGPYTSHTSLRKTLSGLQRLFPLRSCRDAIFRDHARRGRPCIEYEMKRCLAPCCGRVGREEYAELVQGTLLFLRGRSRRLRAELEQAMRRAAAAEDFESAARLRNRLQALDRTVEAQQIVDPKPRDRDVIGLARTGNDAEIQLLQVREGRMVATQGYSLAEVPLDAGAILSSFVAQYYSAEAGREVPPEILLSHAAEDADLLAEWLGERAQRRVALRPARRGAGAAQLQIALANAGHALAQRIARRAGSEEALEQLAQALGLAVPPRRIEAYDVSTLGGALTVASRVRFVDGQPQVSGYRRYRIREASPDDDYACLREVLARRVARAGSDPLPDLLLVDGGRGQLAVAEACLRDAGAGVALAGIAKLREQGSARVVRSGGLKGESLYRPGRKDPVRLAADSSALLLLQRIRDEAHRFAIDYQRALRSRAHLGSILSEVPGIGPGKRRSLLRHFGSLRALRRADESELARAPGIGPRDARLLRRFFEGLDGAGPCDGVNDGGEGEAEDSMSDG